MLKCIHFIPLFILRYYFNIILKQKKGFTDVIIFSIMAISICLTKLAEVV